MYSDQPIDSFQEDLLNRQFFCQNVSNIINNWHLEHSYVISINGDWGSGKTSVMKLIELNLESSNIDKIHFSPWQWSNQASLHSIFLMSYQQP
ncbi:P-loop NTPase fold protein [Aliamphritea spongicola]